MSTRAAVDAPAVPRPRAAPEAGTTPITSRPVVGRAVFLAHSAAPSGAELALLRMARHLDPTRTVVVFAEDGPLLDRMREHGAQVTCVPLRRGKEVTRAAGPLRLVRAGMGLLRYGWALGGTFSHDEIAVVVARSSKAMLYGAVAARRLRVPLVWSVHDRISADYFGRPRATVVRTLGRLLADAYVVNSRATLDTLSTGGKPVLLAPPALDPAAFAEPPVRGPRPASVRRVVMVGRLAPWKGQHVFLEAFARVFAGTDVRAVVVGAPLFGEQAYEAELHRSVAAGPCAAQVELVGHSDDVAAHLRSADVVVHASTIPEPFGLVVTEAMAAGCAVVATAPGGPAEVVTDGVDGLLVPCDDVDALAAALRRLAGDAELRDRLATAAPLRAATYDLRSMVTIMRPWLAKVAVGDPVPPFLSAVPDRGPE